MFLIMTSSHKLVIGEFENTRVDLDYGKLFKREIVLDDLEVYRGVYVWTSVEGESKRRYVYNQSISLKDYLQVLSRETRRVKLGKV